MSADPVIVSLASGKGGVGKTTLATNLGIVAARQGLRVVVADLDFGGADAHLLLGERRPGGTLEDFMERRVATLEEIATPCSAAAGLRLVAGPRSTLKSANPNYGTKQRIARQLRRMAADIVIIDVGAGSNLNSLDFFLMGDDRLLVSTEEPTAVMDAYNFVKLAAVRHVSRAFLARHPINAALANKDFRALTELQALAEEWSGDEAKTMARALERFAVSLVVNNATQSGRLSAIRLGSVIRELVGGRCRLLGMVPNDNAVREATAAMRPVCVGAPTSGAARAIAQLFDKLLQPATFHVARG